MTLPDEEANALFAARRFLRDLLDPKITPNVPSYVREEARSRLKHFPATYRLKKIVEDAYGADMASRVAAPYEEEEKKWRDDVRSERPG